MHGNQHRRSERQSACEQNDMEDGNTGGCVSSLLRSFQLLAFLCGRGLRGSRNGDIRTRGGQRRGGNAGRTAGAMTRSTPLFPALRLQRDFLPVRCDQRGSGSRFGHMTDHVHPEREDFLPPGERHGK